MLFQSDFVEGIKSFDEEPLAYGWWLLHGELDRETALQRIHETAVNDVMESHHSSVGGQVFYDRPVVRATRTRTLVIQRMGLDV